LKQNHFIALAISILITVSGFSGLALAQGEAAKEVVRPIAVTEVVIPAGPQVIQVRPDARQQAFAPDHFWDKMAICETNSNWQDTGQWAGGLGIYTKSSFPKSSMGTWERYGGEEFASSPGKATRDEQIIVANRISVSGYKTVVNRDPDWARRQGVPVTYLWDQKPVGFGGWGCYKSKSTGKYRMAKPQKFYYENHEVVPLFSFRFNEKSKGVHDLQMILGVRVDSHYGPKTREAHIKYLKEKNLPRGGVPGIPLKIMPVTSLSDK
jgi:hypothetical protein